MFRFGLEIPLLSIQTDIMRQSYESNSYTYIAWNIKLWKWYWTLYWGKSRYEELNKKVKPK